MPRRSQDKFRLRVKTHLLRSGLTVTQLALKLGIRRTTVSVAINQDRFPRVQARIAKEIA
jgi:transposase-like protein